MYVYTALVVFRSKTYPTENRPVGLLATTALGAYLMLCTPSDFAKLHALTELDELC